jgi:hypothetical protein
MAEATGRVSGSSAHQLRLRGRELVDLQLDLLARKVVAWRDARQVEGRAWRWRCQRGEKEHQGPHVAPDKTRWKAHLISAFEWRDGLKLQVPWVRGPGCVQFCF